MPRQFGAGEGAPLNWRPSADTVAGKHVVFPRNAVERTGYILPPSCTSACSHIERLSLILTDLLWVRTSLHVLQQPAMCIGFHRGTPLGHKICIDSKASRYAIDQEKRTQENPKPLAFPGTYSPALGERGEATMYRTILLA